MRYPRLLLLASIAASLMRCKQPSPPPPTLHLTGPNVVRFTGAAAKEAATRARLRYLVQGRRGPHGGCVESSRPRSLQGGRQGTVAMWPVELDTVTCEYVIAESDDVPPPVPDSDVVRVETHDTTLRAPRRPPPR